mmetsp:Transcript_4332/g.11142  ORF Transcript_4332/g.11142 Transcript_4332/m.11142 type:complete len:250 (-) Transcript_4332:451-1200(-)
MRSRRRQTCQAQFLPGAARRRCVWRWQWRCGAGTTRCRWPQGMGQASATSCERPSLRPGSTTRRQWPVCCRWCPRIAPGGRCGCWESAGLTTPCKRAPSRGHRWLAVAVPAAAEASNRSCLPKWPRCAGFSGSSCPGTRRCWMMGMRNRIWTATRTRKASARRCHPMPPSTHRTPTATAAAADPASARLTSPSRMGAPGRSTKRVRRPRPATRQSCAGYARSWQTRWPSTCLAGIAPRFRQTTAACGRL